MTDPIAHSVAQIEATLEQHLAWVRDRARDKASWPAVQQHYGLPPTPIAFGGVTPKHVQDVVQQIVRLAATQLDALGTQADPARVEALWNRLAQVTEHEAKAHQARAAGNLGQIFQNATANVDFWQQKQEGWSLQLTLICKSCGAAQQKTRDFKCSYCSGDLFRRRE